MILFENSIVTLDYNPATDILTIRYPDLHHYLFSEIKHSIDKFVDVVRGYDIKRVLLDSSDTIVSVSQEESKELAIYMVNGLNKTRVQKLARLQSFDKTVETRAEENLKQIQQADSPAFQIQIFTSKTEALAWLQDQV